MIKIEKGIPIPPPSKGGRPKSPKTYKYPLPDLDVGDSFLIKTNNPKVIHSVKTSAYQFAQVSGRRFKCRQVQDGIRVWRVEDQHHTEAKA